MKSLVCLRAFRGAGGGRRWAVVDGAWMKAICHRAGIFATGWNIPHAGSQNDSGIVSLHIFLEVFWTPNLHNTESVVSTHTAYYTVDELQIHKPL